MKLEKVYVRAGGRRLPWTYILAPEGQLPAEGPWSCVYITYEREPELAALSTLPRIFEEIDNRHPPKNLAFLFFDQGTSSEQVKEKLGPALDAMKWGIAAAERGGALAWFEDPAAVSQAAYNVAPKLKLKTLRPRRPRNIYGAVLAYPETEPLLALEPNNEAGERLFIHSSDKSSNRVKLASNAAGDGLILTSDLALSVTLGSKRAEKKRSIAALSGGLEIPLAGAGCGGLTFGGTFKALISRLGLGFQYALSSAAGETGILYYPLLDASDGLDGWPFSATLVPTAPLDPTRSFWSPSPQNPEASLRSAFRTLLNRAVLLRPQAGGASRLVFNSTFDEVRYLTPHGTYGLDIEGSATSDGSGLQSQLRCGLSGVEYVQFTPGDLLCFHAGQPASITLDGAGEDVAFRLNGEDSEKTTAWAMVLPADGEAPSVRAYYSQPDQAPFFAKPGQAAAGQQQGYFPVTRASLPDQPGEAEDPYRFPLVPYGALPKLESGFGADAPLVEAFERRFLYPLRRKRVAAMARPQAGLLSHLEGATDAVTAVTPLGYSASFADGRWQELQVAQTRSDRSRVEISFGPQDGDQITDELQDAFLTNQQFLVITAADKLGGFAPTIDLDGWPFDLNPAKNSTIGDYRNVIIFKSAKAAISQLVRQPELWTDYGKFNNRAGDEKGQILSGWLVSYLEEARALYKDGAGVKSLENFIALIDDPQWNGFLALKVDLRDGSPDVPDEIEALLAGIDKSQFFAHHIGNRINHVEPGGDGYALNSALFGLIHYVDPLLGDQADNLPSYIESPLDYDFKVLTLEAVFENAALVSFSNKSILLANDLFGDGVSPQNTGGTKPGANLLELMGAYHNKDGQVSYTFATTPGKVSDFYLQGMGLERVEVTHAHMTVVKTSSGRFLAKFGLRGNLRFHAFSEFDLFSYQRLGFRDLSIDMGFEADGGGREIAFNAAAMEFAPHQNETVDPEADRAAASGQNQIRKGSLLTQFPLQLKDFISGKGDRLPDALGFRTLHTYDPKGIQVPDLAGSDWYGLEFTMNLGGQGALGDGGGLAAQLLLAWKAGGGPAGACLPAIKITGPGGVSLSFDIEGVVKFGAQDIVLNKVPSKAAASPSEAPPVADMFILEFKSIGVSVLSLSFPPKGTTNVVLFGVDRDGGEPILGWFGGYLSKKASQQDQPKALTSDKPSGGGR